MSSDASITVYSTTWCAFCHQAKEYFKSLGLKFNDINVEEDQKAAEEMVRKTGQMGVPVIEIGKTTIVGFDKPRIDAALKEANLSK